MATTPPHRRPHHVDGRFRERLDKMIERGRLNEGEAERVRSAGDPEELSEVVGEVRLRHVTERLAEAVEAGRFTRSEADTLLGRMRNGDDPRSLEHLRRALRRRGDVL